MTTTYTPFRPTRPLTQYRGQPGNEVGGQLLTPDAYDAISTAATSGLPCSLVVAGEWVRDDGARFLDFAVPTAYIEATTDHRYHEGRLRYLCPLCERWNGSHIKGCVNS
jgi:hypothetical protein